MELLIHRKMNKILADFGFCGVQSFNMSLVKFDNSEFIISFSLMGAILSELIGLQTLTLKILFILLLVELIIGIWAGVRRLGKFKVRRLERFGLKVFIYFLILLVFNTFKRQYSDSVAEYYVYSSIYSFIVFYIVAVYLISILENIYYLTGNSPELGALIKIFRLRVFKASKKISEDDKIVIDNDTKI